MVQHEAFKPGLHTQEIDLNFNPILVAEFYNQHISGLDVAANGQQAVGFCPFHGDQAGGHKSLSINLVTGQFRCFSSSCRAAGNVISFSRKLGAAPPSWAGGIDWRGAYIQRLSNDKVVGKEYLITRGISSPYVEYLATNNLFAVSDYKGELSIVFPIFDNYGGVSGLNDVTLSTGAKKTLGSYVGCYWIDTNFTFDKEICLVEGVVNALTLNDLGYNAMSLITSSTIVDGKIFKGCDILLMFDNDVAGRIFSRKAFRELTNVASSIRVISWPPNTPKKFDVNDVIRFINKPREYIDVLIDRATQIDELNDYMRFWRLVHGAI